MAFSQRALTVIDSMLYSFKSSRNVSIKAFLVLIILKSAFSSIIIPSISAAPTAIHARDIRATLSAMSSQSIRARSLLRFLVG